MDAWQYLTVLVSCVAVTLPLEVIGGARVYRRPRALLVTLAPVVAVFAGWDLIAVHHGDWWFSARYTLKARLAGLPVEEWLFFLVVPVCALLTYEVLGRGARGSRFRDLRARRSTSRDGKSGHPASRDGKSGHPASRDGKSGHPAFRDDKSGHSASRDLRSTSPMSRELRSTHPISRDGRASHFTSGDGRSGDPVSHDRGAGRSPFRDGRRAGR